MRNTMTRVLEWLRHEIEAGRYLTRERIDDAAARAMGDVRDGREPTTREVIQRGYAEIESLRSS